VSEHTSVGTLEDAIALASKEHKGQLDKAGQPYILHVLRVVTKVHSVDARIVAALHDLLEDTDITADNLHSFGFSATVVEAVQCLTKTSDDTYPEYIERVATNPIAREVKIADLDDNMDSSRLPVWGVEDTVRYEKYRRAWLRLDLESWHSE
jgi:(p)ppGpp synthase/HD superfamily hydrolase